MDIRKEYTTKLREYYKTKDPLEQLHRLKEIGELEYVKSNPRLVFKNQRLITLLASNVGDFDLVDKLHIERGKYIGWDNTKYKFSKDYIFVVPEVANFFRSLRPQLRDTKNALFIGCFEGMSALYFLDKVFDSPDSIDLLDIEDSYNLRENFSSNTKATIIIEDSYNFKYKKTYDFIHVNGSKVPDDYSTDITRGLDNLAPGGYMLISYLLVYKQKLKRVCDKLLLQRDDIEVTQSVMMEKKPDYWDRKLHIPYYLVKKLPSKR